jgi:hypothetical protein
MAAPAIIAAPYLAMLLRCMFHGGYQSRAAIDRSSPAH